MYFWMYLFMLGKQSWLHSTSRESFPQKKLPTPSQAARTILRRIPLGTIDCIPLMQIRTCYHHVWRNCDIPVSHHLLPVFWKGFPEFFFLHSSILPMNLIWQLDSQHDFWYCWSAWWISVECVLMTNFNFPFEIHHLAIRDSFVQEVFIASQ